MKDRAPAAVWGICQNSDPDSSAMTHVWRRVAGGRKGSL